LDTFLNIFANGDTLARTGMMSGTVASTVAFRLERIMGALDPFVQEYVRLLLPREWLLHNKKAVGSEFGNNLLLVVDGTKVTCPSPRDFHLYRYMYSTKTCDTAWSFFIVTYLSGRIAFVSDLDGGSASDATMWNNSGAKERLAAAFPSDGVTIDDEVYSYAMAMDKGYVFTDQVASWPTIVTKSGEGELNERTPPAHVEFNAGIAVLRSVVERTFSRMKRWGVMQNKIARGAKLTKVINIVAALVNWELEITKTEQI